MPTRKVHAQGESSKSTYYLFSFMKSRPGQDAIKMERDLWKAVHADRVASGATSSWAVMVPVLYGPHPYDYMTVESASSMEKLTSGYNVMPSIEKSWGEDKPKQKQGFERTEKARDQVGNELWMVVDGVGIPAK